MRNPSISKAALACSLLLIFLGTMLSGCSMALMTAKETRTVSAGLSGSPFVEIESQNGSITVVCRPDISEAQVEATIFCRGNTQEQADERLSNTQLVVDSSGDSLKIYPKFPEPRTNGEGASIRLLIPTFETAKLKTSNGSVDVDGKLAAQAGSVEVQTTNAPVTICATQSVVAESSNGTITLKKIAGLVTARTTNAPIFARDIADKLDATTTNGTVSLELKDGQQGPIRASTSNAKIELSVAHDFAGCVTLSTTNALIKILDPGKRVSENRLSQTSGKLIIGSGTSESTLTTSNSSICVEIKANPQDLN